MHKEPFEELLDDRQDEEILPLLQTNKVEEQMWKKYWKVVTQSKTSKDTPLLKEARFKYVQASGKFPIFSEFTLECYF